MKKILLASALAFAIAAPLAAPIAIAADQTVDLKTLNIKTRLAHFTGTKYVLVISYVPQEIVSITCDKWTMLGTDSWKGQNNFTIPAGPSVAVINADKYDGYCKGPGSIVAHTDEGEFIGVLDRGDGNWNASTKLTFHAR